MKFQKTLSLVYMTNKDIIKRTDEIVMYKHYCKCGHSVVIYPMEKKIKKICSWCGSYVYTDKKEEFKEKLGGIIK